MRAVQEMRALYQKTAEARALSRNCVQKKFCYMISTFCVIRRMEDVPGRLRNARSPQILDYVRMYRT